MKTNQKQIKNVGFISTRFQGTDGVSLETEKWVHVLERMGYSCFFFAGQSDWAEDKTMVQPEAFFEHPDIKNIQELSFNSYKRPRELGDKIHQIQKLLKNSLYTFYEKFDLDMIIIENASCIPMNIPLGIAITEFIAETGVATIAHHHDFSWERDRFMINCINDYIEMAFPPSLPSIQHVTINSEARHQMGYRMGLSATIVPNVFDFHNKMDLEDDYTKDLRADLGLEKDDIFFLQPTRVVARKGIEHAIELVHRLKNPKIKIVIAHMSKDEGRSYLDRIIDYAKLMKVELVIRPDLVGKTRKITADGKKIYTLWDLYPKADFVCYPSLYEGFGNAFVEAIYFKKPILVNRYSVYKKDIEPLGFDVVAMDGHITEEVVESVKNLLGNPDKLSETTEKNFNIAKKFFSYSTVEQKLKTMIENFDGVC
ncbi:MAG: glycosyltransferase family 4 protein [Bacteriovoracaceae bacterium]|nr:glycosyltransferase family 4 protein [Bacteriovoracaceae bacterium]